MSEPPDTRIGLALPLTKHPEFYFSDGSIVLRVQGTLLRIHQSVLGRHSDVFGGMWGCPQPEGVVDLHDDMKDVTDTMWAVYDSFHFDSLDPLKSSLGDLLTFVSGVLKISTKYNRVKLRRKCITLLLIKFPNTFENCTQLLQSNSKYDSPEIIRLIRLARQTNVPEVLPWAYYLCTTHVCKRYQKNSLAKSAIWQAQKTYSNSVLFTFTPASQCASSCQTRLLNAVPGTQHIWIWCVFVSTDGHVLREADEMRQSPASSWRQQICTRCMNHQVSLHKIGRQKIWDALPTYFELGDLGGHSSRSNS
ncbi:hypothetical protein BKA70DRAFT_1386324 [Coprinopsis sp. MPI-PUGE-AT-0042]|nr:hypothetical protein BKA70DRAFT_1386324 [Coprinopsis sp. MPI-PUGE-AT-0042]